MKRLKRSLYALSILVLTLAALSLVLSSVYDGGKREISLGLLTKPVRFLAEFPGTVKEVLTSHEIRGIPLSYQARDSAFQEINELEYDLYALNSFYNTKQKAWEVRLFNLKNDSVLHVWDLRKELYDRVAGDVEGNPPINCILMPDRGLIVPLNILARLDSNSNVIWLKDRYVHHSLNLGPDGHIWGCTDHERAIFEYHGGSVMKYRDDLICKFDINTGDVLFEKSVSELLLENGYKNFVFGSSNYGPELGHGDDPIHLNDVQPVFEDSKYWKKGDLFISIRHKSLVFLYRPETNKLIRLIYGPFTFQHDVDVISDHEISIFNNNVTVVTADVRENDGKPFTDIAIDTMFRSEILIYNFEDSTYRTYMNDVIISEGIVTVSEGSNKFMSNGDLFLESQNQGKMFIFNKEGVIFRKQFGTGMPGMIERPNWVRLYEDLNQ